MPIALSRSLDSPPLSLEGPICLYPNLAAQMALTDLGNELLSALGHFLSQASDLNTDPETLSKEILRTDQWGFAYLWYEVSKECKTIENLYEMLEQRKKEILVIREKVRPFIQQILEFENFPRDPYTGAIIIDRGRLSPISEGISGSYCILDESGKPIFVIKPIDEDIGAMNNPKGFASPFEMSFIRDGIPLYGSVFREAATWQIAQAIGVTAIAPQTVLAILQSDGFFDLSKQVSAKELLRYMERLGPADHEKLCSVQRFIPGSKSLFEALHDLQQANFSDEQIASSIDQSDFEEANLLLWTTGETDGHLGNFLVYPKTTDEKGNQIFGIQKIDNGLAFPEQNKGLRNNLIHLPNAKRPLSQDCLAKIRAIDPEKLANILLENNLEGAIAPMRARIEKLQAFVGKNPSASIREINKELSKQKGFDL